MKKLLGYALIAANLIKSRLHFGKHNTNYYWIWGSWYRFIDERKSLTTAIVYKEYIEGFKNCKSKLSSNSKVIDIGAHVGMFAIPLSRRNPTAQIVCYEPNPTNYYNLQRNLELNEVWAQIRAYPFALADYNGHASILHDKENTGGSQVLYSKSGEVKCCTLERLRDISNFDTIDVLKIDVEGSEFSSIRNKEQLEGVGEVIMEIHDKEQPNYGHLYSIVTSVPKYTVMMQQSKECISS